MPFDPNNADLWIDTLTAAMPQFVNRLAKSLYHETLLVHWPRCAMLTVWGLTPQGRVGLPDDPEEAVAALPSPGRALTQPAELEVFKAMVQAQPSAPGTTPHIVATFEYTGGVIPVVPRGLAPWQLVHLYPDLTHYEPPAPEAAQRAARFHTQSAAWVALHPVVLSLIPDYPVLLKVLQARAFTRLPVDHFIGTAFDPLNRFDPEGEFAPDQEHDNCGFVV